MKHHVPADFFVLRTPALPWDVAADWSDGLAAVQAFARGDDLEGALARDVAVLRERLIALVRQPEIRAALCVASPNLDARLEPWLAGDESEAARSVEPAVVRYLMRMAGRPTPFGLFAGASVGKITSRCDLGVAPRAEHEAQTRLNFDCLFALAERLSADEAVRPHLRYRPNETVYESGGRIRYYTLRLSKNLRSYPLCDIPATPHLEVALGAARRQDGATLSEIADAMVGAFEGVELDDALGYTRRLVDAQLLRSPLHPAATGDDPLEQMITALRKIPAASATADALQSIADDLARLDAGISAEEADAIVAKLHALSEGLDTTKLFKVDLRMPRADVTLGHAVARDVSAGMDLLSALAPAEQEQPLARFMSDFSDRYQDREVPLLEVLDSESGIGFESGRPGADVSPLLEGLAFRRPASRKIPWTTREEVLFEKLAQTLSTGAQEMVLTERDVAALSNTQRKPFPPSVNVVFAIAAESPEALEQRKYRLYIHGSGGTTAGALFGRFLQGDATLHEHTRALFRREEQHDPEALHAEIAHLPHALTSNVPCRPVLRDYEIEVGWGSGAPADRRIPLSDLLVSVRGGKVRLRSRAHGKQVVPYLSCAHNFFKGIVPYRFLASLQAQGCDSSLAWVWGQAFRTAPFLPRVVHGKFVLCLARWRLSGERLASIDALAGAARFAAVQALRAELRLPRHVGLVDDDNVLPIDLDNALSLESFLNACKQHGHVSLRETFPAPDELVARSSEGRFHHELVLPFVRATPTATPVPRLAVVKGISPRPERSKRPGEDWLYAKVYCGVATADRVLVEAVAPLVRELRKEGLIDRWFFLRYGDPDWHLRLRLHGEPSVLWQSVAPRLFTALEGARHLVQRHALDTYDPEVERYGGEEAMTIAEALFDADSEAALSIVERFRTDPNARWKLALVGMDAWLTDLGFTVEEKRAIVALAREGQAGRFVSGHELTRQLGRVYRTRRSEVDELLSRPPESYAAGVAAIQKRSVLVSRLTPRLRELEKHDELTTPRADIAVSHLHMWANRLLRGSANAQELVLYEFLHRAYGSAIARGRDVGAMQGVL